MAAVYAEMQLRAINYDGLNTFHSKILFSATYNCLTLIAWAEIFLIGCLAHAEFWECFSQILSVIPENVVRGKICLC